MTKDDRPTPEQTDTQLHEALGRLRDQIAEQLSGEDVKDFERLMETVQSVDQAFSQSPADMMGVRDMALRGFIVYVENVAGAIHDTRAAQYGQIPAEGSLVRFALTAGLVYGFHIGKDSQS